MTRRITGHFAVRRQAELAVEHLVQDCGIDRQAIAVAAEGMDGSAGLVPSGADVDPATGEPGAAPTHGRILVTVEVEEAVAERAEQALRDAATGPV